MKLRYSTSSPFARKAWLAVLELGLEDKVERIPTNPLKREDVLGSPNPLGKIPNLETDDGMVLYDSPVVVEYLDAEHGGNRLVPKSGPARWNALRRQALADGMIDGTVLCFIEGMRKPERQSAGWIAHNRAAVERGLAALEDEAADLGDGENDPATVGHLTIYIALEMADMHFADLDWHASHPKLAAWAEAFAKRPSVQTGPMEDARKPAK
jgi:glutathione S-transferase